jgi:hypothetical protein
MRPTKFRTAYSLSIVITILIIVASAGGLFIEGLYRDNTWTTTQLRGSDLVRLVVAAPALVAALIFTKQGSRRALGIHSGSDGAGKGHDLPDGSDRHGGFLL